MTREGVDEGRAFMWSKVGFIISKKDLAKGGGKFKASSKLGDVEAVGEVGRVVKEGTKAVASVEDGTL